jgi:hypothetical protein
MSRVGTPIGWLILFAVTAIPLVAGCSGPAGGPASGPVAKPTPEESFDVMMELFRRRIEGSPGSFVVEKHGGRSRLMASNTVTSEVFPPSKEGEPYRADVTVHSEARYSIQRTVEEPDGSAKKEEPRNDQRSGIPSLDNAGNGVGILDPDLVTSHGGDQQQPRQTGPTAGESVVTRREDEEKRTFKLEYTNGRWVLLTKPDPKTERSIQEFFDEALATQI